MSNKFFERYDEQVRLVSRMSKLYSQMPDPLHITEFYLKRATALLASALSAAFKVDKTRLRETAQQGGGHAFD